VQQNLLIAYNTTPENLDMVRKNFVGWEDVVRVNRMISALGDDDNFGNIRDPRLFDEILPSAELSYDPEHELIFAFQTLFIPVGLVIANSKRFPEPKFFLVNTQPSIGRDWTIKEGRIIETNVFDLWDTDDTQIEIPCLGVLQPGELEMFINEEFS